MSPEDPFHDGLPRVEGKRVHLRALVAGDARAVYELYRDKEATQYGYSPKMDDLDDASALITEIDGLARSKTLFHWGVELPDGTIVGHATLFRVDLAHRRRRDGEPRPEVLQQVAARLIDRAQRRARAGRVHQAQLDGHLGHEEVEERGGHPVALCAWTGPRANAT